MSFFLDTQETSQRFGNSISEVCSLLDANHISHGSPDHIFEFARVLDNNNQFRVDLSTMVKSIVHRESEEILLTDMMSIIVTSVGGPSFADTAADITKPTNTLMEFLLGTGCWKMFGSFSSPTLSPISKDAGPPPRLPLRAEEPRHTRLNADVSAMSIVSRNPENQAGLLDSSSELRQMLTRIEVNTQQVKRHLDSIEQRINQIEPSPDLLPTRISSPSAVSLNSSSIDVVPREVTQPLTESIPVIEAELPTRSRAVFSQQPHQPQTPDFSSPAFAYATEKGDSITPIALLLALLTIIALSLFFARSGAGHDILKTSMSHLKAARALFSNVHATVPPARTAAISSPPGPSASIATAPTLPPSVPPAPAKSMADVAPTHLVASSAAGAHTSQNIPSDTRPIPLSPKIRYIPANVMEGYLVSAPRPEYPPLARIDHIEGTVALQATISKMGSIETLHVIKGLPLLRNAATDAVRNWRYKPYSVDGRPAEVATTVYVDFTLKPPPGTAR